MGADIGVSPTNLSRRLVANRHRFVNGAAYYVKRRWRN